MFFVIVTFILASILAIVCLWYYVWYNLNRYLKNVPGPAPVPLLGNALEFSSTEKILQTLCSLKKTHGTIYKVIIGFDTTVIISDYRTLEFLLSTTKVMKKSKPYKFLHNWLGQGLLTSSGAKWRKRRKTITPTFHFKILEQFVEVFDSASDVLVGQLEREVGKESMDVYPYVTLCALDIICETAMGTSVNAQINRESEYVRSVKEMCRIVMDRGFSAVEQYDFLYQFTKNYRTEKEALGILHNYTNSVIKHRREELLENAGQVNHQENGQVDGDVSISSGSDVGQKRKMAFLDLLLQTNIDGKALTNEDIREEVDTFMFEGHDTTTSAISFCLYNIAKHPEVQERLIKEQREIFGEDRARMASYNDLQDMKYLEMVIKETLRLYPSVPFYARRTTEDVEINENITVPKNVNLTIFAFGIQRDPEFFEEPDKFDPERFNADNVTKKYIYSYLPFSAGPRNCIGQKFAMLEMKSTVSKVLRYYELKDIAGGHNLQLLALTILKSANGILMKIDKRTW